MSHQIRCFLFTLLWIPGLALAQAAEAPWDAPAFTAEPADLLSAETSAESEENVQILLRERVHRFDADGLGTFRQRFIARLLTQDGVDGWSSWYEGWRPWHQERPQIRARVITAEGTERQLDPATLAELPVGEDSSNVLSDRLQLQAPLPGVGIGAVVEVETVTRDTAPLFPAGTAHRFLFSVGVPVERTRLVIEAPEELGLVWTSRLLPELEPRRSVADGVVRLVFEDGPREAIDPEPLTPTDVPVWPLVGYATGSSWSEVARRYGEIVDAQIGDVDLSRVTAAALDGARTAEEKVARLVEWLHREIRYTGLQYGEAAIVPRPPADTLERTYGDCKDKATLLVALLRQAGVDAHLALLNVASTQDVEPELPGLGLFDHAIVYLPGLDLWIDATDPFSALGELPVLDQGRLALVASAGVEELRRTPEAESRDNRSVETREVFLAAGLGGGRVVETAQTWGSIARNYRAEYAELDDADCEKTFESYTSSTYAADDFLGCEVSDLDDGSSFRLRLEVDGAEVAFTDLGGAAVSIRPVYLLNLLPEVIWEDEEEEEGEDEGEAIEAPEEGEAIGSGRRRTDVELKQPFLSEWRYRITPPPGYRPSELPADAEQTFGPASLKREVRTTAEGVVELDFRFDTGRRRYTPEEFEALRQGAKELFEEGDLLIEFEHVGEARLAEGKIGEALAEFDRLVAADPERALPRTRRARGLLEAGLGEAARREARRAVELEPELDLAHQALGRVLEHGLLGRQLRGAFDREQALAAYRRALELDPRNPVTRQNLAVLLEHDDRGIQFAPGADVEGAIAEYRWIRDELEDTTLDENLAIALAKAGRFDEMLELAEEIVSPNSQALHLVALAKAKGASAAIRAARQLNEAQNESAQTAAQILMVLRFYPEAAELSTAAARGLPSATEVLGLAETMRKTRRWEEVEADPRQPQGLLTKLTILSMLGSPEEILELSSRFARSEDPAEDREKLKRLRRRREVLRAAAVPIDVAVDLSLAGMAISLDGDSELGYRASLRSSLGKNNRSATSYLVREGDEYRVLASSNDVAALGGQALRRLEAGDVAGARRWLDWARDHVAAARADDPWSGHPMTRFWTRGDEGDPAAIRAAAASLAAGGERPREVLTILRQGLESATSEAHRRGFELALARAFSSLEKPEEVVPLARDWLAQDPASVTAFSTLRSALTELDRWEELARAAEERLALRSDDPPALAALAAVAFERGDLESAESLHRRRIDLGKAGAHDHERLAWIDLRRGEVDDETLQHAQQAASLGAYENAGALQTLALVYAELEQSVQARDVLLQKLTLLGEETPRSPEWYVLGRIAESYGVLDAAQAAYAKVEPAATDDPTPLPYERLASRKLAILEDSAAGGVAP